MLTSVDKLFVDDLLSLLDSGMHSDHPGVIIESDSMFNEDMFGYSSSLRVRSNSTRNRAGKVRVGGCLLHRYLHCFCYLHFFKFTSPNRFIFICDGRR